MNVSQDLSIVPSHSDAIMSATPTAYPVVITLAQREGQCAEQLMAFTITPSMGTEGREQPKKLLAAANGVLKMMASALYGPDNRKYAVDIQIAFSDGEVYNGVYKLTKADAHAHGGSIERHIQQSLELMEEMGQFMDADAVQRAHQFWQNRELSVIAS